MQVHIYTRHSRSCGHGDDPQYKRCRCLRWVHYTINGVQVRESTKERTWEKAVNYARAVELRHDGVVDQVVPPPQAPMTLDAAVEDYLADKKTQDVKPATLRARRYWFKVEMVPFFKARGVYYVRDVRLELVRQWRNSWKLAPRTKQKKQTIVKQFFTYCVDSKWIENSPAAKLSTFKVEDNPTDYFREDEFLLLMSVAQDHFEPRMLGLLLLMGWTGLAIQDAVTLERKRLDDDDRVFLHRAKTGVPVRVMLPPDYAQYIRSLDNPNPNYFFWNGKTKVESLTTVWHKEFRKLFAIANLRDNTGAPKRCRPHMLRDTFSIRLLIAGVPMEEVSQLLGHGSIRTTEKHYAPWSGERLAQMEINVRKAWQYAQSISFDTTPARGA